MMRYQNYHLVAAAVCFFVYFLYRFNVYLSSGIKRTDSRSSDDASTKISLYELWNLFPFSM